MLEDKNQCMDKFKAKTIYLFNKNDIVFKDGVMRVKRKYGKFKREIVKYDYK